MTTGRFLANLGFSILVAVVLLVLTAIVLFQVADPVLAQPPKKVYTGTQWLLRDLKRGAERYRTEHGVWPVDDERSTFLYKLMGGGERPPYLQFHHMNNVYALCHVYQMTSPEYSPWADADKHFAHHTPYYVPRSNIDWPAEHNVQATPFGGAGDFGLRNWDSVPQDPAVCPWLAKDVAGYDQFGGRFHLEPRDDDCLVYSEGRNQEDDDGTWDDIRRPLSAWMLVAYHPLDVLLWLGIVAAAAVVYYSWVIRRHSLRRSNSPARPEPQADGSDPIAER